MGKWPIESRIEPIGTRLEDSGTSTRSVLCWTGGPAGNIHSLEVQQVVWLERQ